MIDGSQFFECQCETGSHTMRFVVNKNLDYPGDQPEIYVSFYLSGGEPWWKRIKTGLMYLMGFSCVREGWNEWFMKPEDAKRMRDMCDEILDAVK